MNKLNAENLTPQGDFIIVEKIDYDKEEKTDSGIIIKQSQILDSVFLQAKVLAMGPGLPIPNGNIPEVGYQVDDIILYDVRGRQGAQPDFDIIRREHVVAVVTDETE
jgi:co-chaperonin GroES (HSP10)|tara:strand:+ start:322 stop:642 length:321 start_codon:yes stop_codon:yes gene_type:complete